MIEPVLLLMAASEFHHKYSVEQVVRTIMVPLHMNQHQGLVEDGRLVAWCSWAFMNDETKDKFLEGKYRVQPEDWNNGDNLVFMDFIAPYGHTRAFHRQIRELFKHYEGAVWLRRPKNNRRVEVKNGR